MRRRRLLRALPAAALPGVAGCLGDGSTGTETATTTSPPTTSPPTTSAPDGPAGVYVQSFREGMATFGPVTEGDYTFALLLAVPHDFWTVTGTERSPKKKSDEHAVHLMAQVWHEESGQVLADTSLSVELLQDGELVSEEVIYPMLSQRMGFHYGGNFSLPGDGSYTARLSVAGVQIGRMGSFADKFGEPATAEVDFEFDEQVREKMTVTDLEAAGQKGAIRPMEMGMMPIGIAPEPEDLPGMTIGTKRVDDADLVTKAVVGGRFADSDQAYLYVSARTPYNDLLLPMMGLDATVTRDGETLYEGKLARAIDPELHYHYGATMPVVESGDEVQLTVTVPPQVARHEGYERAFLQMDGATLRV
ncbi:DUF7350 domain-containing protein [Haloarchaeobius amylolyticus]|uniref:DUF7350 domain-containing protein n=1 Tax=Haloarchaeobius amylolyticus TaxID=1198296 RepID=UPI0022717ADE|nr:fe2+ transport protein [Haloarchaeobius amylolyticus]